LIPNKSSGVAVGFDGWACVGGWLAGDVDRAVAGTTRGDVEARDVTSALGGGSGGGGAADPEATALAGLGDDTTGSTESCVSTD
jgi:hypothetical protein